MTTITYKDTELKVKKTFDLFGQKAYIARTVLDWRDYGRELKICDKYWDVYLQKNDKSFGILSLESKTIKNASIEAIDKIEAYAKSSNITCEQLMEKILK